MVAIIAIIAIGIFVLIRSHYLEKLVNRLLAERIASQYNLDITIGEIQGSFVGGFVLNDVNVRFFQPPDTVTLAFFPSISINYQASNLWHKRWIIDSLRFDRPQLFLQRDTTGHWRLPVVKDGSKVQIIPVDKLDYVKAEDDYIALCSGNKNYLKQQTISNIEKQLDPARFVRIHRSYIVNLERIARIEPYTKDSRVVILRNGTHIPASRSGLDKLKTHLGEDV